MSFLKKIAGAILKGVQIVSRVGPGVSAAFPRLSGEVAVVTGELAMLGQVIVTVETIGQVLGHSGPDKLKAATPLVAQAILQSSMLVGHKIENTALFNAGAQKVADGLVDVLNALSGDVVNSSAPA